LPLLKASCPTLSSPREKNKWEKPLLLTKGAPQFELFLKLSLSSLLDKDDPLELSTGK